LTRTQKAQEAFSFKQQEVLDLFIQEMKVKLGGGSVD